VWNLVKERSQDEDPLIRAAAVKAIVKIAEQQQHQPTMDLVEVLIDDDEPNVSAAALKAYGEFAQKGNLWNQRLVSVKLEDTNECVRAAAVEAMAELATGRWV